MANYEIWLKSDSWVRLATLPQSSAIQFVRNVNGVGSFEIKFPSIDWSILEVDRIIEIWRSVPGEVPSTRVFTGFLRKWSLETNKSNEKETVLVGPDLNDIMEAKIVAYKKDSKQAEKEGHADDLIKAIARENFGELSHEDPDRNLTSAGVTIQANTGLGPDVSESIEWNNVLAAMKKIADKSAHETEVFFDMVQTGESSLQFRTWIDQRGLDLSTGKGIVEFSLEKGNLESPKVIYDHTKELNFIYVSGSNTKGKGKDLLIRRVSDDDRIAKSVWNRREKYESAPSDTSKKGLTGVGEKALVLGAPIKRLTGDIIDTGAARWTKDWNFGDRVLARYGDEHLSAVIRQMSVTVDGDGNENIRASIDNTPGRHPPEDPLSAMIYTIRNLEGRVGSTGFSGGFYCDFTGTEYDTVEKCNYAGLRFSDTDTPFPSEIAHDVSGSWAHEAGRGWEPATTVTGEGPAIVFPVEQTSEWQFEIEFDLTDAVIATKSFLEAGHMSSSNHVGGYAGLLDASAAATVVQCRLYTNNGDDTYTAQYIGTITTGALVYTLRYQSKNGTIRAWDPDDEEWHEYTGKATTGVSFGAANGFIHIRKMSTDVIDQVYVKSLRVRYLSGEG